MATNLPDRVSDQRNQIVDRVIADMEKGGFEWLKPWKDTAAPHNPLTGTTYKGGNRLHLAAMAMIRGYDDPRWVTFNQAKKAGWKIHKGAKSCVIEKWKMFAVKESDAKSENESDDPSVRHIPRCVGYWSVFNTSEFDGVPPLPAALFAKLPATSPATTLLLMLSTCRRGIVSTAMRHFSSRCCMRWGILPGTPMPSADLFQASSAPKSTHTRNLLPSFLPCSVLLTLGCQATSIQIPSIMSNMLPTCKAGGRP